MDLLVIRNSLITRAAFAKNFSESGRTFLMFCQVFFWIFNIFLNLMTLQESTSVPGMDAAQRTGQASLRRTVKTSEIPLCMLTKQQKFNIMNR